MKIRKFQKKDKKSVKRLIGSILKEVCNLNPGQLKGRLKDLENIKNNFMVFFVVEDKKKIIGTIGLVKEGESFALARLYVKKQYRGGVIAQKLYNKFENFCRANKIRKIILSTTSEMERAIRFYIKDGYKKIKGINIKKEGKKYEVVFMEKKL